MEAKAFLSLKIFYNDTNHFRLPTSPAVVDEAKCMGPLQKELLLILKEIRIITDKVGFRFILAVMYWGEVGRGEIKSAKKIQQINVKLK